MAFDTSCEKTKVCWFIDQLSIKSGVNQPLRPIVSVVVLLDLQKLPQAPECNVFNNQSFPGVLKWVAESPPRVAASTLTQPGKVEEAGCMVGIRYVYCI